MKLFILFAMSLMAVGCAGQSTAPGTARGTTVITTSDGGASMVTTDIATHAAKVRIPAPAERVATAVVRAYETVGIPLTTMDSDARIFGNVQFTTSRIDGKRMSTFVNCGTGPFAAPNADSYRVTLAITTEVVPVEDGSEVRTRVMGSGVPRGVSANPVSCDSTGRLEGLIHQAAQRIASESGEG